MKVSVKDLDATIEVKNNGIELEVRDPKGKFLGDLVVNKTGLIWCKGKTTRAKGEAITWSTFIQLMEER